MTEYIAIDRDGLAEQLGELSEVFAEYQDEMAGEDVGKATRALVEIRTLMHNIDKPVRVSDHGYGVEIYVRREDR